MSLMRVFWRVLLSNLLILGLLWIDSAVLQAAQYSTPVKINPVFGYSPQINDKGQMAWCQNQNPGYYINFYNGSSNVILPNSKVSSYQVEIKINNKGQVAWIGFDGTDEEVYFWDGVNTRQLTNDGLDATSLDLNERGELAWYNGSSGFYRPYLYSGGAVKPLGEVQSGYASVLDLNDNGEVAWAGGGDIYLYSSTNPYNPNKKIDQGFNPALTNLGLVAYTKKGGLYVYSGGTSKELVSPIGNSIEHFKMNDQGMIVYFSNNQLYFNLGNSNKITSSSNNKGKYHLNIYGQVIWTENYLTPTYTYTEDMFTYNFMTGFSQLLTPGNYEARDCAIDNKGNIIWSGFILNTSKSSGIYRSIPVKSGDNVVRFNYTYYYNNGKGDFYSGYLYQIDSWYWVGSTKETIDENKETGYYKITSAVKADSNYTMIGRVWVTGYYDAETKKTNTPLNSSLGSSTYLGNELGYIKNAGVEAYKFGRGYYEADAGDTYTYRYTYGNGDYYEGKVYRDPLSTVYYPGYKLNTVNELKLTGYYEIKGVSHTGVDSSKYGQVFVSKYYDGDTTKKSFVPVGSTLPKGTNYLKSELGFIKRAGVLVYRFGMGLYEADAGDTNTFRYTYTNGDYYEGRFYADPLSTVYYPGYKLKTVNELKLTGYYEIKGVSHSGADSSKYGQVFLTKYYDGNLTKKSFVPVGSALPKGTNYLKSELGYIKNAGVLVYRFGMGLYEADAGDTYTFRYTYTNGDYYEGKIYADPLNTAYYPGQKINVVNELGKTGYYDIKTVSYTTASSSLYGKVYVTKYYDGDKTTPKSYTGTQLLPTNPMYTWFGAGYLKTEHGYIGSRTTSVSPNYFGKGFYEADL